MSLVGEPQALNITLLPLSIFENFFLSYSLHEAKKELNEIKEQALKNYPHAAGSFEYDNAQFFFEKLEELIDAAYRLNVK
jgi:hypothetical protein